MARALLTLAFAVYLTVVSLSALGLHPFAERGTSLRILLVAVLVALLTAGVPRIALLSHLLADRPEHGPSAPPQQVTSARQLPLSAGLRSVCWTVLGTALLLSLAAWLLAWWLPVGAYDALGYRLPAVAQWLDAGAVTWVVGDDPLRNGYPLGLEVIEAVLFSALGSARAVDCVASFFLLVGAAALAGFARQLGVGRTVAALAAGLFLLVPMHLLNAPSGYADAAFAGVLVAFLVAVARWAVPVASADNRAARIDLGLSACLVIALKPHGLAFVALGLALGLVLRTRAAGFRRAAQEFVLSAALALPGLFFAVRNVIETGNPVYPLEVRLGGHLLLRGESSLDGILTPDFNVPAALAAIPAWLRPLWVWLQPYGAATEFDDRLAGHGYAFVLVGLPALCWALSGARSSSSARFPALRGDVVRSLRVVGGLTAMCWLLQPFAFWPRFTSWLWGAAALSVALLVSALVDQGRGKSALTVALAVALLALPEALYALAHVKRVDQLGMALLEQDAVTSLSRVAGVDQGFVRRFLLGRADLCRTPWRLGTDDANLDGVAAQLLPRPRMHVLKQAHFPELIAAARERGCERLIVIGDNPVLASAPPGWAARVETVTAFGTCRVIPVLSAEVTP